MDKEDQALFVQTAESFGRILNHLSPGVTPILGAVLVGDVQLVENLIHAGFDPNDSASPKYGAPLQVACRMGRADIAGTLVEGGADVTDKDMAAAIDGKDLDCVELLVAPYIEYCGVGRGSSEIFLRAVKSGYTAIVRRLLDAPLGYDDSSFISQPLAGSYEFPLSLAVLNNNASMLQALIDRGGDVQARVTDVDGNVQSLLRYACLVASEDVVRALLDAGLDVNEERGGNLLIHDVAEQREIEPRAVEKQARIMSLLMDRGADITAKNSHGRSLMQIVARSEPLRQLVASVKTAHSIESIFEQDGLGQAMPSQRERKPSSFDPL